MQVAGPGGNSVCRYVPTHDTPPPLEVRKELKIINSLGLTQFVDDFSPTPRPIPRVAEASQWPQVSQDLQYPSIVS